MKILKNKWDFTCTEKSGECFMFLHKRTMYGLIHIWYYCTNPYAFWPHSFPCSNVWTVIWTRFPYLFWKYKTIRHGNCSWKRKLVRYPINNRPVRHSNRCKADHLGSSSTTNTELILYTEKIQWTWKVNGTNASTIAPAVKARGRRRGCTMARILIAQIVDIDGIHTE